MTEFSETPAMKYRMSLTFDRLDSRKYAIWFAYSGAQQLLVGLPVDEDWNQSALEDAWRVSFGSELPADVELIPIETLSAAVASTLPESGMRKLSDAEIAVIHAVCDDGDDFTVDMLWLLVEGLGWTIGQPVPYSDPGWLAVWAEEERCGSYMAIVCKALCMDEPEWGLMGLKMPEVVAKAYAEAATALHPEARAQHFEDQERGHP